MTQNELYKSLTTGGAFALPYLITVSQPGAGTLRFVNNNEDVVFDGYTYKASAFKYSRPYVVGGVLQNGVLEITAIDSDILALIDNSTEQLEISAVGVLDENGTVTPFKSFRHQYGTVTTDESMRITISFTNDDRLDMKFPPYTFDSDNNAGNA